MRLFYWHTSCILYTVQESTRHLCCLYVQPHVHRRKPQILEATEKPKCRLQGNIKTKLRYIGNESWERVHMTQDGRGLLDLVKTAVNRERRKFV